MWPLLFWRAIREKNVGEKSRFSWFREFFFYFLDLVSFTFTNLGKNSKLFFFFNYLLFCCCNI